MTWNYETTSPNIHIFETDTAVRKRRIKSLQVKMIHLGLSAKLGIPKFVKLVQGQG